MKAKVKLKTRKRPRTYEFEFVLDGPDAVHAASPPADFDRVMDALYFASDRRAFPGVSCGRLVMGFFQKARTLDEALMLAFAVVKKAGLRLEIVDVKIEAPAPPADRRKKRRAS